MLVIIGHGPSIVGKGLGPWLDTQTIVRLKGAKIPDPADWGTRTDYLAGTHLLYRRESEEFWLLPKPNQPHVEQEGIRVADGDRWRRYYAQFKPTYKASTGLSAIWSAVEFMQPKVLGLAGFDNLLYPHEKGWHKWNLARHSYQWMHDSQAEHDCAHSLGVELIDVTKVNHVAVC